MPHSASTNCSPDSRAHIVRGYLLIAASSLCWGLSATLGRAVFTGRLLADAPHHIDPLIIAQSRTTFALLILAPILLARRRSVSLRMAGRDLWLCLAIGVFGIAGSNFFYYLAIQRTNVATAIILQYTAPVWVLLYMAARGRQRATLRRVLSVALAVVGCALAIGVGGTASLRLDTLGVIAAILASFTFSYYNLVGAELLERHQRWPILLYAFLSAAMFWQLVNPPWKIAAAHFTGGQWLFMVVFAITSVLLPFLLYFAGLAYLDVTRAIVVSCLEPVFAIGSSAAALGEVIRPIQMIGVAVVLIATILVQLPDPTTRRDAVLVEPIE